MRALVLAAGLGTRLRPLTENTPKPLVALAGRTIVENVFDVLALHGIKEALINVHYLPEKMREFVSLWNARGGVPSLSVQDETMEILGSGGAIAKAAPWLFHGERNALICNSDVVILPAPDLRIMASHHRALEEGYGVECTLSVMAHPEAGAKYNGIRRSGELVAGFEQPGVHDPALWHFPGYYVINEKALSRIPASGRSFSIVNTLWQPLIAEKKLGSWVCAGDYFDLGTVADLQIAEEALAKGKS